MAKEYIDWNQNNFNSPSSDAVGTALNIGNMIPGVGGAIAGIGSAIYDQWNSGQQLEDEMMLMDHAYQNQQGLNQQQAAIQQGLNQQGHDLQMQMWEQTNAPAQVAMLREAGLNPALMYKQGGPGGITGSQTGGSAQGGQAQKGQAMQRRQLMDMQNLMMKAQLDNLNAQTRKTNEEATNIAGGERDKLDTEVNALIAKTKLTNEQTAYIEKEFKLALDELANEIKRTGIMDYDAKSKRIGAEAQKSGAEAQHKVADAKVIDTLTKKIELTVREKIAQMNIDQSNKEAWMKFASDQIGTLIKAGTDIFKAITQLEGDLARAFGDVIPG
jgi:hypothetical protein